MHSQLLLPSDLFHCCRCWSSASVVCKNISVRVLTTAQLSSLECCDYVTCGCRLSFYTLHSLLQCCLATCKSRHFYFCFWHFILRNFVKKLQVPVSTNCGNNYHTYHCIEKYLVVWRKCEKLKKKFSTMRYIHTRL